VRLAFRPLATLQTAHAAHAGGAVPGARWIVPSATARLLGGARTLVRPRDGRLALLFEAGDADAPVVRLDGRTLYLGLALDDAAVWNVTPAPPGFPAVPLAWSNAAAPGALAPDAALVAPDAPTGARQAMREVRAAGGVGLVAVTVAEDQHLAPPTLTVAFAARSEPLRYYVVARRLPDAEFAQLAVQDAGFAQDARAPIAFERLAADAFGPGELAPALLAGGGDERVTCFRSTVALPRQARARRRLQLVRNGDVLVADLPHAGPERPDAGLVVHLARP
jgi:hypothetical protein